MHAMPGYFHVGKHSSMEHLLRPYLCSSSATPAHVLYFHAPWDMAAMADLEHRQGLSMSSMQLCFPTQTHSRLAGCRMGVPQRHERLTCGVPTCPCPWVLCGVSQLLSETGPP